MAGSIPVICFNMSPASWLSTPAWLLRRVAWFSMVFTLPEVLSYLEKEKHSVRGEERREEERRGEKRRGDNGEKIGKRRRAEKGNGEESREEKRRGKERRAGGGGRTHMLFRFPSSSLTWFSRDMRPLMRARLFPESARASPALCSTSSAFTRCLGGETASHSEHDSNSQKIGS